MTTGTFTAVSDEQLLASADSLDAATCVMHGSAYQPSHKAVKLMQKLAKNRTIETDDSASVVRGLVAELRHFSNTVARPASDKMQTAARLLSNILDAQGFNGK
jgi:hypothetical protein